MSQLTPLGNVVDQPNQTMMLGLMAKTFLQDKGSLAHISKADKENIRDFLNDELGSTTTKKQRLNTGLSNFIICLFDLSV